MPPRKEEWRRKRRKAGGRILNEESMKAINKADTVIQDFLASLCLGERFQKTLPC